MIESPAIEFPYEETEKRLRFILEMMPSSGRSLLAFQNEVHISNSSSGQADHVFMQKADMHIERSLLSALHQAFPDDTINSEEASIQGEGDFQWWLDPVDGSRNFIHGLPLFCTSAGIAFRGSPVAGVVHVPAFKDSYHAILGSGAYKNDFPINVSGISELERALIVSGLPYHRKGIIQELMTDIASFVGSGIGLRRTGSLVLDLCWLAEGKLDGLWERSVKPFDTCAASVIVQEAGGKLSDLKGQNYYLHVSDIVASNLNLHSNLVDILQKTRRVEGFN